jgi:REP element-mobilizing transposase RayT
MPAHFQSVELDAFVIMPNHIHGVIRINEGHMGVRVPGLRGEGFEYIVVLPTRCEGMSTGMGGGWG